MTLRGSIKGDSVAGMDGLPLATGRRVIYVMRRVVCSGKWRKWRGSCEEVQAVEAFDLDPHDILDDPGLLCARALSSN